jgi:hypothetical protein
LAQQVKQVLKDQQEQLGQQDQLVKQVLKDQPEQLGQQDQLEQLDQQVKKEIKEYKVK